MLRVYCSFRAARLGCAAVGQFVHTSKVLESDGLTVIVGLFNFCVPSTSNIDRYVFGSRFHACSTRKPGMSRHNSVGKTIEQPWAATTALPG